MSRPTTNQAAKAMTPSTFRGHPLWHELLTSDVEGSGRFLAALHGWKTQAWEGPEEYAMLMDGDRALAGLAALPPEEVANGTASHWLTYFGSDDVDATVADAEKAGAQRLMVVDVPTVGRMGVMRDPAGALFAAYRPVPMPEGTPPPAQPIGWYELHTGDPAAAATFYERVFGWVNTGDIPLGGGAVYRTFGMHADRAMGGYFDEGVKQGGITPQWLLYHTVEDVGAAIARARKAGAEIPREAMEVAGGARVATGIDPQGARFGLIQPGAEG